MKKVGTCTPSIPNLSSQFEKAVQIRALFIKREEKNCTVKEYSSGETEVTTKPQNLSSSSYNFNKSIDDHMESTWSVGHRNRDMDTKLEASLICW